MDQPQANRRVFLGMPSYGGVVASAAKAFWRASKTPNDVHFECRESSLLALNCNTLWCSALNMVHRGERVDYFAMQHGDVEPHDGWLDVMIEELESQNLDILGAVVPIKDHAGRTSIALERRDGDNWCPHCRLTMHEVYRLPETFTSDDVGFPILLNTGLWVCKFDSEWARQVRFTINDRIVFDKSQNAYVPQVEPEDWYFSRLLHELGLKIGATRKIPLLHHGITAFPNNCPWGSEAYDLEYVKETVVPDAVEQTSNKQELLEV